MTSMSGDYFPLKGHKKKSNVSDKTIFLLFKTRNIKYYAHSSLKLKNLKFCMYKIKLLYDYLLEYYSAI